MPTVVQSIKKSSSLYEYEWHGNDEVGVQREVLSVRSQEVVAVWLEAPSYRRRPGWRRGARSGQRGKAARDIAPSSAGVGDHDGLAISQRVVRCMYIRSRARLVRRFLYPSFLFLFSSSSWDSVSREAFCKHFRIFPLTPLALYSIAQAGDSFLWKGRLMTSCLVGSPKNEKRSGEIIIFLSSLHCTTCSTKKAVQLLKVGGTESNEVKWSQIVRRMGRRDSTGGAESMYTKQIRKAKMN